MIEVHAIIEHLRQQKEDLLIRISDLKIQLRKEKALPPQVQVTDLVTVNDALGAIYSFSLSFVDSWEVWQSLFSIYLHQILTLIPSSLRSF